MQANVHGVRTAEGNAYLSMIPGSPGSESSDRLCRANDLHPDLVSSI